MAWSARDPQLMHLKMCLPTFLPGPFRFELRAEHVLYLAGTTQQKCHGTTLSSFTLFQQAPIPHPFQPPAANAVRPLPQLDILALEELA